MGYECKALIIRQHKIHNYSGKLIHLYNDTVAVIDLSKTGKNYKHKEYFTQQLEGEINNPMSDSEDRYTNKDMYNDHITYTDNIPLLIEQLENYNKIENYYRVDMLIGLLKGINKDRYNIVVDEKIGETKTEYKIIVAHYGY